MKNFFVRQETEAGFERMLTFTHVSTVSDAGCARFFARQETEPGFERMCAPAHVSTVIAVRRAHFFVAALLFSMLVVFAACNRAPDIEPPVEVPAPYEEDTPEFAEGLHLYAETGSVTPTGLRMGIANNSAEQIGYGLEFHIEAYANGEWEQVPFITDVAWRQPLFILPPNTLIYDDISWEYLHGELPPGRYRVAREILVDFHAREFEYFHAVFDVAEDWQRVNEQWQLRQEYLAAQAFARFAGLDLEILQGDARGLTFRLANNNPTYTYIIENAFVGWEFEEPPGSGFGAAAVEYSIFIRGIIGGNLSWPFGNDTRLAPGQYISTHISWYETIGELHPGMAANSPHPNIFEMVMYVTLDVDEEYIAENLNQRIPGIPGVSHRIKAEFDISE